MQSMYWLLLLFLRRMLMRISLVEIRPDVVKHWERERRQQVLLENLLEYFITKIQRCASYKKLLTFYIFF